MATTPETDGGSPARESEIRLTSEQSTIDPLPARHHETPPGSRSVVWMTTLALGMLAGLASFAIGEVAPRLVPPSYDLAPEFRSGQRAGIEIERRRSISRDLACEIAYGGMGLALGLVLGVAGGLSRGSAKAAILAGLLGAALGAVAGAGVTKVVLPAYHATRAAATDENYTSDLGLALRTHGGIWAAVGLAAGLALGLGLGGGSRVVRSAVGGLLGAGLAAVIYEFAGAIVFPLDETFRPMAVAWPPRLLAHLAVALCVSVLALWAADNLRLRRGAAT